MRRICAWCQADMGDDGSGEPGETHGLCEDCADEQMRKVEEYEARRREDATE